MAANKGKSGIRSFVYLIGFGFILITLLVVSGLKKYNENLFDMSYKVNIQKLNESLLLMCASGIDFFYSPMFIKEGETYSYDNTSGEFLQKYFELKKYCGTSADGCFASKYKDEHKKIYKPDFKGACAILKNGTSICLTPQISNNNITGFMDMNGPYGPNIYGKDLRDFEIKARKMRFREETAENVMTVNTPSQE